MKFLIPQSLHFAPMEGITDPSYRQAVSKLYPAWDTFSTDFLRIPTVGGLKPEKIIEHMGVNIYNNEEIKEKTVFQVLTTLRAQTTQALPLITNLNIHHLDLNLGCPSRKVNSHGGGSFLLSEIEPLVKIIKLIRSQYKHFFSVKIRVGYRDDTLFETLLKVFEDEGVDAITIHARTRDQLYKGIADWSYIKRATEIVKLPIIGNGDIWTLEDIDKIYQRTNCSSIMIARGALKTPWLAELYRTKNNYSKDELLEIRKQKLPLYFQSIFEQYKNKDLEDFLILKRFKAFSRYLFDDFENPTELKSKFLRTQSLSLFFEYLADLPEK